VKSSFCANAVLVLAIAMFITCATVLPACAPKEQVAVPSKEQQPIEIVALADLTGPYATVSANVLPGFEDAVAAINDRGGVLGHPVKFEILDFAGDVKRGLSLYATVAARERKPAFMLTSLSTLDMALRDRFAEDEIVCLTSGASTPALHPPGWLFGVYPAYVSMFGGFADWMVKDWQKTKTHEGNIRLAYVSWDGAFGRSIDSEETAAYLKSKGVDVVAREWMPILTMSATDYLLRVKEAKPDWIVGSYHAFVFSVVLKDANALGLVPPKVRFANIMAGTDILLFSLAPDATKTIEPYAWSSTPTFGDADNPFIQLCDKYITERHGEVPQLRNNVYPVAWRVPLVGCAAAKRVIKDKGYEGLTGKNMYDALCKMKGVDVEKEFLGVSYGYTIDYGPDDRQLDLVQIQQATKDAKIVPVSPFFHVPDLLPGGKDVP